MRGRLAAAVAILGVSLIAPASATVACTGEPVVKQDQSGDSIDPFDVPGSPVLPRLPASTDLVAWRAEWVEQGLLVTWTTSSPLAPPAGRSAIRLYLLGYSGPFSAGPAYVFVELRRTPAGVLRWSYGLGTHQPADVSTRTHRRWNDHWIAEEAPLVAGTTVTGVVPARRMYWGERWNIFHWQGIGASESGPDPEHNVSQFFHGQATSPAAAVAVLDQAEATGLWGIADASPADRVAGDPWSGYEIAYQRGSPGYAPELCRRDVPADGTDPALCSWRWQSATAGWFAAEFSVSSGGARPLLEWSFGTAGSAGAVLAIGMASAAGEAEIFFQRSLSGEAAAAALRRAGRTAIPLPVVSNVGSGGVGNRTSPFTRTGRWWVFAVAAGTQTVDVTFSLEAPGVVCGEERIGDRAGYVPGTAFPRATGASVSPTSLPLASAQAGGRVAVRAHHTMFALLSGTGGPLGGVGRLWEKAADGSIQRVDSIVPPLCSCSEVAHSGILEVGPPGRYVFGIDATATSGIVDWSDIGLIWADLDLR